MEKLSRYYHRLGITPGSSLEQIRQAYADAEKGVHEDRFSDDPMVRRKAQEQLSAINEAYLALVDTYQEVQASLGESESGKVLPPPANEPASLPGKPPDTAPGSFTAAARSGADGKERAAAPEHVDTVGTSVTDTAPEDAPDPAGPLKREMVRLVAVLAAVCALLLIARFKSGRSAVEQTAPLAPQYAQTDPADIRRDAEGGNPQAQTLMGFLFMEGRGMRKDPAESAAWFGRGAAQGNAEAQDWLGYLYETGQGVAQDYREAARWYRLAAEQGNVDAQKNLGLMYATGRGVPQSSQEAAKWLAKAAEQGNEEARGALQKGLR